MAAHHQVVFVAGQRQGFEGELDFRHHCQPVTHRPHETIARVEIRRLSVCQQGQNIYVIRPQQVSQHGREGLRVAGNSTPRVNISGKNQRPHTVEESLH